MNWDEVTNDNTPDFSFEDQFKEAKVLSVYDGDTIKVAFPSDGTMYRWNCRLSGVDTPEIRTKDLKEKEYGYKVRDALREKILGKIVRVKCGEFDKYGRLLLEVFLEDLSVNQWLIDNKYAFEYDGGTKKQWFD